MSLNLNPTTELEAINSMLFVIGEAPVNTVEATGVVDAVVARQILAQACRETQLVGWHWNTEIDYPLLPTFPSGEIVLPPNTLRVDTTGDDAGYDLVQRGNRLYDRKNHTFKINKRVLVQIVLYLPFEQLPEAARAFIAMRAARQFQERMVGSDTIWRFNAQDEIKAWGNLLNAEAETTGMNIFTDNPSLQVMTNRTMLGGP